jgi:hypothetical protein
LRRLLPILKNALIIDTAQSRTPHFETASLIIVSFLSRTEEFPANFPGRIRTAKAYDERSHLTFIP